MIEWKMQELNYIPIYIHDYDWEEIEKALDGVETLLGPLTEAYEAGILDGAVIESLDTIVIFVERILKEMGKYPPRHEEE